MRWDHKTSGPSSTPGYANENLQLIADAISRIQREFTYDNLNRLQTAQDLAGSSQSSGAATASSNETQDNTLESSQQLGGPGWATASASLAANATAAPDGSETAGVVTASAGATDSYITDIVASPAVYDGAAFSGSVWLRVPSGTLATYIFITQSGDQGFSLAETAVTLTTQWQRFMVSGTLENGPTSLAMQIGGGGSIQGGEVYDVWGPELGPLASDGTVTNILPSSEQVTGPSWVIENGAVASSSAVAPDGTSTAATVTANSGSTDTYLVDYVQNPSQYSGKTVTASVYLRVASGSQKLNLYLINVGSSGFTIPGSAAVTLTTSWQRFDVTATDQSGLTTAYLQIGGGYSLTSGQSISVWGAQMVVGSSQDGYVETQNTTSVTGTSQTLAANGLNEGYSYDRVTSILQP